MMNIRSGLTLSALASMLHGMISLSAANAMDEIVRYIVADSAEQDTAIRNYWSPGRIAALDPHVEAPEVLSGAADGSQWISGGAVSSTVGRLFFSKPDGDESCAATIVESLNESVAVTAAHCVRDTNLNPERPTPGGWTKNLIFAPGFHDGRAPFGFYTVREVAISSRWAQPSAGFMNYDYAFLVLNRDGEGRTATGVVGTAQSIAFGTPVPRRLHQFGYPRYSIDGAREIQPAFRGQRLAACWGVPHIIDSPEFGFVRSEGVPCTMGSGASGGPHFADFDSRLGVGTVVGVNSYLGAGREDSAIIHLMGPPLGISAQILYESAQRVRV